MASSASLQLGSVTFTIYTKITVFSVTAKGENVEKSAEKTRAPHE